MMATLEVQPEKTEIALSACFWRLQQFDPWFFTHSTYHLPNHGLCVVDPLEK